MSAVAKLISCRKKSESKINGMLRTIAERMLLSRNTDNVIQLTLSVGNLGDGVLCIFKSLKTNCSFFFFHFIPCMSSLFPVKSNVHGLFLTAKTENQTKSEMHTSHS